MDSGMHDLEYHSLMPPYVLLAETNRAFTRRGFFRSEHGLDTIEWETSYPKRSDERRMLFGGLWLDLSPIGWKVWMYNLSHPNGSKLELSSSSYDLIVYRLHLLQYKGGLVSLGEKLP